MPTFTEEDCRKVNQKIAKLEERLDGLWHEVEVINGIVEEVEDDIAEVEEQENEIRDEYFEKKKPQEDLQNELDAAYDRLDDLPGEISDKQTECSEKETEFYDAMEKFATADANLGAKETEFIESQNHYDYLSEKVHELGDDPEADEDALENYVTQLEDWIEYMEGLEEEIDTLTEEKAIAEAAFDSAERAKEDCVAELDELLDEQVTLEGRIPEIEHELEEIGDIESIDDQLWELYLLKNNLTNEKLLYEKERQRILDEIDEIFGQVDAFMSDRDAHCA